MSENNTPLNNGANRPNTPRPEMRRNPSERTEDDAIPVRRPVRAAPDAPSARPAQGSGTPANGVNPNRRPSNPSGAQRIPQNPAGAQRIPQNPAGAQRIPQNPAGAQRIPQNPAGAQRIPQNPAGAQRIPQNPAGAQRIPQNPANAGNPAAKNSGENVNPRTPPSASGGTRTVSEKKPVSRETVSSDGAEQENHTSSLAAKKDDNKKKTTLSKAGAEMMSSAVKAIIYIVAVFVVAIFLSIIIIRVGNDVFALVKSDEAVDITIEENATLSDVSQLLYENNIISFPGIFTFYGNLKKDDGVFIAGDYTISPSMSYDDLREAFKPKPVTGTSWITIPEGYTVDEIIALMESYGIGSRSEYIKVINEYDFDYWFVKEIPDNPDRAYRLEGYLFPDTYEFYNNSSEVTVINKMLARFDEIVVQDYIDRVDELNEMYGYTTDENKLTFDDIITLASIIEKEGSHANYYAQISSVFHNRLKNPGQFPKLESDATTYYGMQVKNNGVRPEKLSADEIKNSDTPYNTYANKGLPPGAISNPSASAIRFALYPYVPKKAEGERDLYFFVEGASRPYFASTMPEHEANIAKAKAEIEMLNKKD